MSRKLAELVLPNRGFGGDGRFGKASPRAAAGHSNRGAAVPSPELEVVDVKYASSTIIMKWRMNWGMIKPHLPREIIVSIDSEAGPITFDSWLDEGLGEFPFRLEELNISHAPCAVESTSINNGAGVRLKVDAVQVKAGLMLEGQLHVKMPELDGKLLRPIIGVRIAAENGVAE
jgi:hypothetical protein